MVTEIIDRRSVSWLTLPRLRARQAQFLLDISVLVAAFLLAYLLRFDFWIPQAEIRHAIMQLPYVVTLQCLMLTLAGVYSFIWRYIGMSEVRAFLKAALLSAIPLFAIRLGLPEHFIDIQVPLSVTFMATVLAFGGVLGLRVMRRAHHEWRLRRQKAGHSRLGNKNAVLLIGAGRAGVIAAREIRDNGSSGLELKGFVDDDTNKKASLIHGIRVLGTTEDLPDLVQRHEIDHVVITIASASRRDFRRIVSICEEIPVKVRVIPPLYEILRGSVTVSRIRDLQIEDLLGREPVHLDEVGMENFLVGKTVMVTGAGGSIGSELVRQVARFNPARLLLVERAEFALFEIDRELHRTFSHLAKVSLVADVGDRARMRSIFQRYQPEVVLHAAAHKHVPMMEHNSTEAVKNNVLGTHSLGEVAGEFGAEVFVLVSTDKAVRPTSVMGASKRTAELVVQDLNHRFSTRYVAVRFGNVIGSAGSVIPIFREQILKGGPVTVTHPAMTRYFMTIPEASQLVLQAGSMGRGGEIFILDMGEPVRILDLAREAIRLSGLKPVEDIDIMFTGIRPGEKLFEELEISEEHMTKTRHPKIFIGKIAAYPRSEVQQALARLVAAVAAGDESDLRRFFGEFLPESQLEDECIQLTSASHAEGSPHSPELYERSGPLFVFGNGHVQPLRPSLDAIAASSD